MRLPAAMMIAILGSGFLSAQSDPPARVARLNYINGSVQFQPAGVDEWVAAPLNRPLITGDHFWVDDRSSGEMHVGSNVVRMAGDTAVSFLNLNDQTVQLRVSQGLVEIRLRSLGENDVFEVDTPNSAFSLLRPGVYRIEVSPNSPTTFLTVRGGEGEVTGGGQAFTLHPREMARITGEDSITYDISAPPPPDGWEQWCSDRDRREDQAQSVRYVSREMIGYEDLDENGTWRSAPGYGMVWYPRAVAPGWAPYRYGHWAWIDPWGWTWVDDAPWGFAPFHYGRWVYVGGGWAWVPGPIAPRPVYAPALVAWVGGPHFNLSVSIGGGSGHVAWFPLGPGDVFVPAYRTSPRYFTNVNTTNTVVNNNVNITKVYNTTVINNTNITNVNNTNTNTTYVNRNAPGAITAVPQDAMIRSRPVAQAAVNVSPAALASAPVSYSAQVAPSRQSVLGANAPVSSRPPVAAFDRPVVAKLAPAPRPVPFAVKQQALQANPGRPLAADQVQALQQRSNANVRPVVKQLPAPRPQAVAVETAASPRPRPAMPAVAPAGTRPAAENRPEPHAAFREAPRAVEAPREIVRPRAVESNPQRRVEKKEEKREERRDERRQ